MKKVKNDANGEKYNVVYSGLGNVENGWYKCDMSIWPADVYLYVGDWDNLKPSARERFKDDSKVLGAIEKWERRNVELGECGMFSSAGLYFIRMDKFCPCVIYDLVLLMHETLHATQRMLDDIGVEQDPSGSEVLAYTHGHLFLQLFKALTRSKDAKQGAKA